MKEHSRIIKPTQHYLTASARIFRILLKSFGVLLVMGFMRLRAYADELPKSLMDAVAQVQTEEAEKAFGVLSRYAYTDNHEQRLTARMALAQLDREAGRLDRAITWVEDYQNPQAENFEWPRVNAYVESAKIQFMRGNAFESVKRLTDAKDKTSGLAKVSVERALAWVVEQKPDLKQALDYEKSALKSGEGYFKRKKISDTAGLEPAKAGTEIWKELKPEIETRIAELERKIRIDSYGLDFVLYSEAQEFRKASHPLALDFTNVAAAFDQKGEIGGQVPGADYEMAVERYTEILEFFAQNPYGQAAKLYLAVCAAKTGDPDGAIKQLKAFYKEDPDGLYRGEALKLIGDLYLFAKWDEANARESYERSIRWVEATETRTRVLDTYLVPEKSTEVSKPPKEVRRITEHGEIHQVIINKDILLNRVTAAWYLNNIKIESEEKIVFILMTQNKWEEAKKHLNNIKNNDKTLAKAVKEGFYNAYDRLLQSSKQGEITLSPVEMIGIPSDRKLIFQWGDFNFMIGDFIIAESIYNQIEWFSIKAELRNEYIRVVLAKNLLKKAKNDKSRRSDAEKLYQLCVEYPNTPSTPYLLYRCALMGDLPYISSREIFSELIEKYPKSRFASRSQIAIITRCLNVTDHEERKKLIELYKLNYPQHKNEIEALENLDERFSLYNEY